jgi:hypothetical protein
MRRRQLILLPLAAALAGALVFIAPVATAQSARRADAAKLTFNGVDYVYRWGKAGQFEFLPPHDSDLAKWQDMVTINLHESATTGEHVAELANKVVANYQRAGKVMRTDSKPGTPNRPAEHLIVAVFGNPDFLEAAFARMVRSTASVSWWLSTRTGSTAGRPAMTDWLKANGPRDRGRADGLGSRAGPSGAEEAASAQLMSPEGPGHALARCMRYCSDVSLASGRHAQAEARTASVWPLRQRIFAAHLQPMPREPRRPAAVAMQRVQQRVRRHADQMDVVRPRRRAR